MAAGRPVIAYRGGGALEIIKENETGIFFEQQTVNSLTEALKSFRSENFNSEIIRQHALQFDKDIFKNKINTYVNQWLK